MSTFIISSNLVELIEIEGFEGFEGFLDAFKPKCHPIEIILV